MLTIDICVFCFYDTDDWESNGRSVSRDEAIFTPYGKSLRKKKVRPHIGLPAGVREVLPYLLNITIVAFARSTDTSAINIDLIADILPKFDFRVLRTDFAGVTCAEDVAIKLSGAIDREETDLDLVMQMLTGLQSRKKLCIIVENFHHVARLPHLIAKSIEGVMRSYCQTHSNAAWLFMGNKEMLPAFITYERPFYHSGFLFAEDDICRP
jgi:hypothetical protein